MRAEKPIDRLQMIESIKEKEAAHRIGWSPFCGRKLEHTLYVRVWQTTPEMEYVDRVDQLIGSFFFDMFPVHGNE
jgi:hypothetical protein